MGWDKNENQPAGLENFNARYKTEELNDFIASVDELARTAAENAKTSSDERIKSFAEFTNNLLATMTQQANNIHFDQDSLVEDRRKNLNAWLEMIKNADTEYDNWHAPKYNMFEMVPGAGAFKEFDALKKNIIDEINRLGEYEPEQKAAEKDIRWKNHVDEFYKNHAESMNSVALKQAVDNATALYDLVNKYSEEYAPFSAIPKSSVTVLKRLVQSVSSYNYALKQISVYNDTEREAVDKFKAMRYTQTKGLSMAGDIDAVLKLDLPFGFKDKLLACVKGLNGDGVYQDLNNITQDSNDTIELLDISEKKMSGLDLNKLPEINADNLGDLDLSWKYDAIDLIETLGYEQQDPQSEIDHEHFMSLVQEFEDFVGTQLPGQNGYNDRFNFDDDMDLMQAQMILADNDTIPAIDKERLDKGNYYAQRASSRAEKLIDIQNSIQIYMYNIASAQRELTQAGNLDMARALGKFGIRFAKFNNAMAKDLETISKTGIRTELSAMQESELKDRITPINYAKFSAEYSKEMSERDRINAEREAQEKIEAQKREEENRIKAELDRKAAEEKALKEEVARLEREQRQKEYEERIRKEEEAYKAKRAEEERAEAERKRIADEETKQEKLLNEEYHKKETLRKAESKRQSDIRKKYIDIMDRGKTNLVYGNPGDKIGVGFVQDFMKARYTLLNSLPADNEISKDIYRDLTAMSDRMENTSLIARYYNDHPDTDPKYQLAKHSREMEKLTAIKGILTKLAVLVPTLKDEYVSLGSQDVLNEKQMSLLSAMGMVKPEGNLKQAVMDAGKALTEIYHNAFKDGRYIYEKSSQIEAPGIGNIKAFENEDFSFDKLFGLAPKEPEVHHEEAPEVHEEAVIDPLKQFFAEKIAAALGTEPDPAHFEESAEYFITHGNDNNRNRIFSKANGDIITQIKTAIANGEKIFITLPDRKYNTMDTSEVVLNDDIPSLQIPKQEYDAMHVTVREICKRVNATGETKNDSPEFKEFKAKLNEIAEAGIPRTTNEYFESLNDLALKAFAYGYAKLDQSMNTRRDARFTEASQIIEIYRAVCAHEKPSMDHMNMNMIASKYLKVQLTNDLDSKNPETVEKALAIMEDPMKFNEGIEKLIASDVFKNKFKNMSSKALEKYAHKHANDITKDINKEKQKLQVQQINI